MTHRLPQGLIRPCRALLWAAALTSSGAQVHAQSAPPMPAALPETTQTATPTEARTATDRLNERIIADYARNGNALFGRGLLVSVGQSIGRSDTGDPGVTSSANQTTLDINGSLGSRVSLSAGLASARRSIYILGLSQSGYAAERTHIASVGVGLLALREGDLLPEVSVRLQHQGGRDAAAGGTRTAALSLSKRLQSSQIGLDLSHSYSWRDVAVASETDAAAPPVVTRNSAQSFGLAIQSSLTVNHKLVLISQASVDRAQGGSVTSTFTLGFAYAFWPRQVLRTSYSNSQSAASGSNISFTLSRELS